MVKKKADLEKRLSIVWFCLLSSSRLLLSGTDYYVSSSRGLDGPDRGSFSYPLKTIGAALEKSDAMTVWIDSGVYRESLILPRSGMTLRALPGADVKIKGSDVVNGWVRQKPLSEKIWKVRWRINSQQVFVDGKPLQQIGVNCPFNSERNSLGHILLPPVGSGVEDMTENSFYFDPVDSWLYISLSTADNQDPDPNHHTVEASVRNCIIPYNYNEDRNDIRLIDLQFFHSNASAEGKTDSLVSVSGKDWLVQRCTFNDGDFRGLLVAGTGHRIIDCVCDRNGCVGFSVHGSDKAHGFKAWDRPPQDILVSGCRFDYNNYRRFYSQWNSAGAKNVTSCRGVYFSRCQARFNRGAGIWFDILARDNIVDRCIVTDNSDSGLEYEISDRAVFSNNIVIRNGFVNNNAGIFISCSNDVLVVDNILYGNNMGIVLNNYGRSEHPDMKNNMVVNNNIMSSVYDDFVLALDPSPMESRWHGNVSDYNTYGRIGGNIRITYRIYGSDPVCYRDLADLKNAASMEVHSRCGDPFPSADKELSELIADSRDS